MNSYRICVCGLSALGRNVGLFLVSSRLIEQFPVRTGANSSSPNTASASASCRRQSFLGSPNIAPIKPQRAVRGGMGKLSAVVIAYGRRKWAISEAVSKIVKFLASLMKIENPTFEFHQVS